MVFTSVKRGPSSSSSPSLVQAATTGRPRRRLLAIALALATVVLTYNLILLFNTDASGSGGRSVAPTTTTTTNSLSLRTFLLSLLAPLTRGRGRMANTDSIPRTIHQTWNTSDLALFKSQTPERFAWFDTWTDRNPTYRHVLYDDAQAAAYVRTHFPGRVVRAYTKLPLVVQKTDLFRYLVLLRHGGVYADLDTENLRGADLWVPPRSRNVRFIAGLEWDYEGNGTTLQVCQWTMASAPRHPILAALVERIVAAVEAAPVESLRDVDSVVGLTGPVPWTEAIRAYLTSQGEDLDRAQPYSVGSIQLADVLVLGITSFSPWHKRASKLGKDDPSAFVHHQFTGDKAGGWKLEAAKKAAAAAEKDLDGDAPMDKAQR
ncbi:nucleotide-diphospho-sugar transferase [Zopfochytrium polystomum]|nr:nucleotide-diphospho-sugar transferase [Zopfochytrium polystomum]